jgi:glyoxylase-like metal-dependent hydrolase (beta-lactamase superfamily II)
MQRDQASLDEQKARLPQITYRDRLTIHLGGKEIQILYLGRGHTRSDSIIFVPQDRIAYVSELYFSDQFLYINDGYGVSWLKTLDAIEALPADIFIPWHGPIPQDSRRLHRTGYPTQCVERCLDFDSPGQPSSQDSATSYRRRRA